MKLPSSELNVDILITSEIDNINKYIANLKFSKCMAIIDHTVFNLYKELKHFNYDDIILLKAEEETKGIGKYLEIIEELIEKEYDRSSLLIGIGGGVVGDLVGFVASTYKRGIRYINIPTTLLAMVDSSIGGKTAINFKYYKNQIGTFYQPVFIGMWTNFLDTLPFSEFWSGMGEIIKYGYTLDPTIFDIINIDKINSIKANISKDTINALIEKSVYCKKNIVEQDERESGLREVLNFGHTVGHAFESYFKYTFSHGINVIFGMIVEIVISNIIFNFDINHSIKLLQLLKTIGIKFPTSFSTTEIIKIMKNDKKVKDGHIRMTLLKDIGKYENGVCVNDKVIYTSFEKLMGLID